MRVKESTIPDFVLLGDEYARSLAIDWLTDQGRDDVVAAVRAVPQSHLDVTVLLGGESVVEANALDVAERHALATHLEGLGRTLEAHLLRMTGSDGDVPLEVDSSGEIHPQPMDFAEYADMVTYINQRQYGDGMTEGEWWYADDRTLTVYGGSFGNYNSPGSDSYTNHEEYDTQEAYNARVAELEAMPEWLEEDEDEDEEPQEPAEGDYVTEDYENFYQDGRLVVTVGEDEDWQPAVRAHMEANQFWPAVWQGDDHGGYERLDI